MLPITVWPLYEASCTSLLTFASSELYCDSYCVRSLPLVAPFARLTSTSRMLDISFDTSFSAELVVDSKP